MDNRRWVSSPGIAASVCVCVCVFECVYFTEKGSQPKVNREFVSPLKSLKMLDNDVHTSSVN